MQMPFSVQWDGADELLRKMDKLPEKAAKVAAQALYEGAGVMADAVSQAVRGIATEPFRYAVGGHRRKPSPEEKALLEAAPKGVAKFRKNGVSVDTSVGLGLSGYGQIKDKTKPVPQIANAINSGTSFMEKQPFFRKAVSQAKGQALKTIDSGIQKRIEEMTK